MSGVVAAEGGHYGRSGATVRAGGWLVARMSGADAWLHVQDFEIDVAFRLGLLESKRLQSLAERLERWILRVWQMQSRKFGRPDLPGDLRPS
jgi:hypothetical protein